MGESGLISCSNVLHFLAVGLAVGSWSASPEAIYTSSRVPGESLEAVWGLSCPSAGTACRRQMFTSATAISTAASMELLQGTASFKRLSNRRSEGTDMAHAVLKRETWSLFIN